MTNKNYMEAGMRKFFSVLFLLTVMYLGQCGPDLTQFEYLSTPQISAKPDQNMLVIEIQGDPNVTGGQAIKDLYKSFYQLKKHYIGLRPAAPRARWLQGLETDKDKWVAQWGLPIPAEVQDLTVLKNVPQGMRVIQWHYGTIAEILHTGSYATETPTIEKLHAFIQAQGYSINGPHEEEYLKGPGMFGKGNPDKYKTIIRYPVIQK